MLYLKNDNMWCILVTLYLCWKKVIGKIILIDM